MAENTGLFQGFFRQIQEWVQQEIQTRLTAAGIRGQTIDASNIRGVLGVGTTVSAHAASHQNAGSDEISVVGLSGLLADAQTALAHATSHQNAGSDEINVAGLSGVLADPQTAAAHASSHQNAGGDEISVAGLSGLLADQQTPVNHDHSGDAGDGGTFDGTNLTSGGAIDGYVLAADGAGGAAWEAQFDADAIHDNVASEISTITEKAVLVGADILLIEDSAAAYVKKRVQITNLPGGADAAAIHDNVASEISAITEKVTPIAADLIIIEDSAAANVKKRVQIGNLPGGGGASIPPEQGLFNLMGWF